ncbi:YVTN family beta-propeller repeat protein [Azohydromonas aeria]|uniref:YVTN family beta-propeller repeat protein n=1 Tax=Azohydromonas aeria TaxID=2590212 RepID=UPI001E5B4606|nr:YncE family protein [Azohydromonas aeria]
MKLLMKMARAGAGLCLVGAAGWAAAQSVVPTVAPATAPAAALPPVFVLNSQDANVSVLDRATMAPKALIATGKEPHHLYLTPDEKSVIVANALSDSLTFIDPKTAQVQRTITGIIDPYHLRFSPDMKWFVTAANRLDHIDIYRWDPANAAQPLQLAKRIPAGKTPSHLAIDTKSSVVYSSLQDSDELIAIDLRTQAPRWRIPVGKMPADVYLTPDDRTLLVGLTGDEVVEAYDVSGAQPKLVKRIPTGKGAHAFRSRGDGRHLFVSNRVANTISMIDTQSLSVVSTLPAPGGPDCMELLSDGKTLLVSSRWARKVTVIDIEKKQVVQQVPVGRSPHGIWTLDHAPRH